MGIRWWLAEGALHLATDDQQNIYQLWRNWHSDLREWCQAAGHTRIVAHKKDGFWFTVSLDLLLCLDEKKH
jgi:hypothetical protein